MAAAPFVLQAPSNRDARFEPVDLDNEAATKTDPPFVLSIETAQYRPLKAARLCLQIEWGPDRGRIVVLDAASRDFVKLLEVPKPWTYRALSLSRDGTRVVIRARNDDTKSVNLMVTDFATGRSTVVDENYSGTDWGAAISPDKTALAVLATDMADHVEVSRVDLAAGSRSQLWSASDGPLGAIISWSPAGDLIAVGCDTRRARGVSTVILDAITGQEIQRIKRSAPLPCSNGTWLDDRTLIVRDLRTEFSARWKAIDVLDGTSTEYEWPPTASVGWLAYFHGRVLHAIRDPGLRGKRYVSSALELMQQEPFMTLKPSTLDLNFIDVAPDAAGPGISSA